MASAKPDRDRSGGVLLADQQCGCSPRRVLCQPLRRGVLDAADGREVASLDGVQHHLDQQLMGYGENNLFVAAQQEVQGRPGAVAHVASALSTGESCVAAVLLLPGVVL